MTRHKLKSKTGQNRYKSAARRVLISEFCLVGLNLLETHNTTEPNALLNYEFTSVENGYYPNFPVLIQGDGQPWVIGNLYLITKLQREVGYESRTFRGIADHLLDYLRFLEDENLDYLYFPKNDRLKVTYRYRQRLIDFVSAGQLSASTASSRINAVINLYRGMMHWDLIAEESLEGIAFTEIKKYITVNSTFGVLKNISVKSHNLAIPNTKKQSQAEYINDGGYLRPLPLSQQNILLKALLSSSREYQLMFYFALFTGARVQAVGTLRIKHLLCELDGNGYLRIPIGTGTLLDNKNGKRMTLLVPKWLVKEIKIYSRSPEAIKRRSRSYYGETPENYVFLSKSGTPYYTSKKEILDRHDSSISLNAGILDRARDVSIQDGAALRTHIRQILLPRIHRITQDFQGFTFHDLRATFGMNLLESMIKQTGHQGITAALDYVQQRMGHTNKGTTMQYLNYKSRLEWKSNIQNEFETYLFEHVSISTTI